MFDTITDFESGTDTVYHQRVDSIPVVVEKEVPVNYLTKWQQTRLHILNVVAALLLAYLAYRIGRKRLR